MDDTRNLPTRIKLERDMADDEQRIRWRDTVKAALAKYDGRRLQVGRIQAILEKTMPGVRVRRGTGQVYVVPADLPRDHGGLFIGYEPKDFDPFSLETFEERAVAMGSAAVVRNAYRREVLATRLPEDIDDARRDLAMARGRLSDLKGAVHCSVAHGLDDGVPE